MIILAMAMINQQTELTSDVRHQQFRQISHGHEPRMEKSPPHTKFYMDKTLYQTYYG